MNKYIERVVVAKAGGQVFTLKQNEENKVKVKVGEFSFELNGIKGISSITRFLSSQTSCKVIKEKAVVQAGKYTYRLKQNSKGKLTIKVAGHKLVFKDSRSLYQVTRFLEEENTSTLFVDNGKYITIGYDGHVSVYDKLEDSASSISDYHKLGGYSSLEAYLSDLMVTNKNGNLKIKKLEEEA